MDEEKKQTVGSLARELMLKEPPKHSATEQMQESLTDWDKNIHECLETHKKIFHGDFYIVVITKRERLMQNVLRNYFIGRISCPTPDYDQTVFKYTLKNDHLELVWVVPCKEACLCLLDSSNAVNPSQYELLHNVLNFHDGTLFRLSQELNNEHAAKESQGHLVVLKEENRND